MTQTVAGEISLALAVSSFSLLSSSIARVSIIHFPKESLTPHAKKSTLIRGELFYLSNLSKSSNVCKTGQITSMLRPTTILLGAPVTRAKITDVDNLLQKHFGLDWKESI